MVILNNSISNFHQDALFKNFEKKNCHVLSQVTLSATCQRFEGGRISVYNHLDEVMKRNLCWCSTGAKQ